MSDETFLSTVDKEKLNSMMKETEQQVEYFSSVATETARNIH